ncbi:hypothetical protein [Celeribacter sp.]|uniref:hypothetical protein n=1 Tax=Celeribacter sp. TaxID=1890673 RepID=UPI003A8F48E9
MLDASDLRAALRILMTLMCAAIVSVVIATPSAAQSSDTERGFFLHAEKPWGACDGNCSWTIMGGKQVTTTMAQLIGVADFTQGEFGFIPRIPFSEWEWEESYYIGGALSRRLLTFGHHRVGEVISLEGEIGLAKRFGTQTEFETWGALYARWHLFPWGRWVKTSVGVSTGLSYTPSISDWEVDRSGNGEGSRLLHYLSPEMTFSLPDTPNQELVFRLAHRSGGSDMFGPNSIFNNTSGGAQYFVVGMRYKF